MRSAPAPANRSFFSGKQVLMLSSVDWGSAWQRHQVLATALSEAGAEVFFVENTGFRAPRLRDLSRILGRLSRLFSSQPRRRDRRIFTPFVLPRRTRCSGP